MPTIGEMSENDSANAERRVKSRVGAAPEVVDSDGAGWVSMAYLSGLSGRGAYGSESRYVESARAIRPQPEPVGGPSYCGRNPGWRSPSADSSTSTACP